MALRYQSAIKKAEVAVRVVGVIIWMFFVWCRGALSVHKVIFHRVWMAPLLLRAPALFSSQQSASVIGLDFFFHVHHFILVCPPRTRVCVYIRKPFIRLKKLGVISVRVRSICSERGAVLFLGRCSDGATPGKYMRLVTAKKLSKTPNRLTNAPCMQHDYIYSSPTGCCTEIRFTFRNGPSADETHLLKKQTHTKLVELKLMVQDIEILKTCIIYIAF